MAPAHCESIIGGQVTDEGIVGIGEERRFGTTTVKGTEKGFLPSRPSGRGMLLTQMDEVLHDAVIDGEPDNFMMISNPSGGKWKITAVSVAEATKFCDKSAIQK